MDCFVYIRQNGHMKNPVAGTHAELPVGRRRSRPARVATFRNSRGETLAPASVTASEAKSEFGRVLEMAMQGGAVVITKHDAPKAVLISVENFNALSGATDTTLDTLNREFDALLAGMQTSKARRGMKTAFAASGRKLGQAAVAAARRRG
jgi:prevent-host-death family protein